MESSSSFTFSPHIAVQVREFDRAIAFYENVLGWKRDGASDNEVEFRFGSMTIYVERNPKGQTFFEFYVENVDDARSLLEEHGCAITATTTPEGKTGFIACDPFGLCYHICEKP
jgi:catechol 2,3-dioxygenase-like lactoylglutathione lyase family enzyme